MNFKRIEDSDMDQSQDFGGVNLRGNRIMEMDMDVAAGKIKLVDGRMTTKEDKDVCVISKELAELNGLQVGDSLQSVSYTHLDVYKRQILGTVIFLFMKGYNSYLNTITYTLGIIIISMLLGKIKMAENYERMTERESSFD